MGWLGDKFRSIGRVCGKAIEVTGKIIGSKTIENIGRGIHDACSETSRRVSETSEYDKQSAAVSQTAYMSEILSSFSIGLEQQVDRIEENCILESQRYFDDLIKSLENTDVGIKTNRLKVTLNKVKDSINGSLKKYLAKRVSLDDMECLNILQMSSGNGKEKAMQVFGKKVINEALDKLSKEISDIVNEQNNEIQEFLEDVLEKQEKELSAMRTQFKSIDIQTENDVINKEKAKLTPLIIIAATDTAISILDDN